MSTDRISRRRLKRSRTDRVLTGLLGGLANYLGVDPALVRILFLVLFFFTSAWLSLVLIYFLSSLVVPLESPLDEGEGGGGS